MRKRLNAALLELFDQDEINVRVYNAAVGFVPVCEFIGGEGPSVFIHGPDSVVFLWEEKQDSRSKYATVSAEGIGLLISIPAKIEWRGYALGVLGSTADGEEK